MTKQQVFDAKDQLVNLFPDHEQEIPNRQGQEEGKEKYFDKRFANNKEHCFYEETTKRQMFLIIEQLCALLKTENESWTDYAKEELKIIKENGIK